MKKLLFLFWSCSMLAQVHDTQQVVVAFDSGIKVENNDYKTFLQKIEGIPQIQQLYPFEIRPLYCFTEADLERMTSQALKVSGNASSIDNLRNTFELIIPNNSTYPKEKLLEALSKNPSVRYVEQSSLKPVQPPFDIPPVTPNYLSGQTYVGADPGVNMEYAWGLGLSGEGIRVRNIEYGFNKNHEEFAHRPNVYLAPHLTINSNLDVEWQEHGTAVFGIVYGDPSDYGVKGMAHGAAELILYPEYTTQYDYNRYMAVSQAINNSALGDVIIYEMQIQGVPTAGSNDDNYVPAEYSLSIWNLTRAATDMGIIVVAAAGNGNQNLDAAAYQSYMDRGDSGAIIVGAGTSDTSHNRISTSYWGSTYGSRVDLQGWGQDVLSAGYGDYTAIGGDFNQRYTMFSGTSSATPIVASCVIVLQSYYYSLFNEYLSPEQMRDILKSTGRPQGTAVAGNIGPLPDMQAAITYLNSLKSDVFEALKLTIYPNPFTDFIHIDNVEQSDSEVKIEIYNALGQLVIQTTTGQQQRVDTSTLTKGMYLIKVLYQGKDKVYKFVKN
ncbi:MAG: S8 family peptidase [Bacteroidota bacterium]|nr:S8 family peptidase [Bacteroidota bacterium]